MTEMEDLREVWAYLQYSHALEKADVIIGFGCPDRAVAQRAAALFQEGWAPHLLFSGGLGKCTDGFFEKPEAELFAEIAQGLGVPKSALLIENRSTNTGENIFFSRELLEQKGIVPKTVLVVHQPNMGRRIFAALSKQWEGPRFLIAPGSCALEAYLARLLEEGVPREDILSNILGDFQRITVFAQRGYQLPQEVPEAARQAYQRLVDRGYTKYLV